jgi:hypothetical protein
VSQISKGGLFLRTATKIAGDIEALAAPASGAGEVALQAFRGLGFSGILEACGLGRQTKAAPAQAAARTVRPASERGTGIWLRENSFLDRLPGADFSRIYDMALRRAADDLFKAKPDADRLPNARLSTCIGPEAAVLSDMTNARIEG